MTCQLHNQSCAGTIHRVRIGDRWVELCRNHMEMAYLQRA